MRHFPTRGTCSLAALLAILLLPAAEGASAAESIRIRPGFQKILDRRGVTRISVGNPEVLAAQPLPRGGGILLVGKKEGETDLVLWEKGTRREWHVEVRAQKTGPEEKKSLLFYDLKIIEISRGENAQVGIRWPDALPAKGTFTAGTGDSGTFSVGTDFDARLNILLADGRARILSNPRLACESGVEAHFLAGGEIPIVIITPETRTVEWKTYGIILKIRPTMAADGRISTQVTAEVSSVDHGSGTSEVPGFLTRRVSTHFTTPPGETVMLSGLVKSDMAKDVSKVPLLGQIPVLGELFKSRSFRENRTELAIFITPVEVRDGAAPEAATWESRAEKEKENLRFRLLD